MDWSSQLEGLALVALAGVLGGVVGFEREMAHKPAGLRTHIFVAASAALLVVLGQTMVDSFHRAEGTQVVAADPIRIVQAIVVGISFLGAGTIFRHRKSDVKGLTTAASILLTSGIGIAVGAKQFILAVGVTVLSVIVLFGLGGLSRLANQGSADAARNHSNDTKDEA